MSNANNETVGVLGETASTAPGSSGVRGSLINAAPQAGSGLITPAGVVGVSQSQNGNAPRVYGLHSASTGTSAGAQGETASTDANAVGISGVVLPQSPGSFSAAVRGINNGTGTTGIGVYGQQNGSAGADTSTSTEAAVASTR